MRSDEELMRDPAGAGELASRYDRPLFDYFRHNLLDAHAAEDLKQEALLRVHRERATYRAEGRFRSWLFRIAHNLLVEEWRRRRVRMERELTDPPDEAITPPAAIARDERMVRVFQALRQLPPVYREALVLAYFDGLSYAEIAALTGTNPGTVGSRVHAALAFLRDKTRE